MCILFLYTNPKPEVNTYRLIIASNRDEFYNRPAKFAHLHADATTIGGRDMEADREGGMWLGVSLNGNDGYRMRFGALLNVTGEEKQSGCKARGTIVTNYLKGDLGATEYIKILQNTREPYSAYNFIAAELSNENATVFHQSNAPATCTTYTGEQYLGFGNSTVKSPLAKVKAGKEYFSNVVNTFNDVKSQQCLQNELLKLLKWDAKHLPDPELEQRAPYTFQYLSSVYVQIMEEGGYGTRTHSIVLVDYDWNLEFVEVSMQHPIDPENPRWHTENLKARL